MAGNNLGGLVLAGCRLPSSLTGTLSFFRNERTCGCAPSGAAWPARRWRCRQEAQHRRGVPAGLHRSSPTSRRDHALPDDRDPLSTSCGADTGNGFWNAAHEPADGEPWTSASRWAATSSPFSLLSCAPRKGAGRWKAAGSLAWARCSCSWPCSRGGHAPAHLQGLLHLPASLKGGHGPDAHNVTGVPVLGRFYLMITLQRADDLHTMYMPSGIATAYAG